MHWRIAWKILWWMEVKFPHPLNLVHWQQRRHEKQKNRETLTCIRDLQKYYSGIFTATVNYSISPVWDSCGFIPNDNKGIFVQTPVQLLIGIPTNAAQPPAVAAGVTWRSPWLNMKMLCETQVLFIFFIFFFFLMRKQTNMGRLKRLWGYIWGIWGLVRTGVKQLICFFSHKVPFYKFRNTNTWNGGSERTGTMETMTRCVPVCLLACMLLHHHHHSRANEAWSNLFSA